MTVLTNKLDACRDNESSAPEDPAALAATQWDRDDLEANVHRFRAAAQHKDAQLQELYVSYAMTWTWWASQAHSAHTTTSQTHSRSAHKGTGIKAGLLVLHQWMRRRNDTGLRQAWTRWVHFALADQLRAARTREAASATAVHNQR